MKIKCPYIKECEKYYTEFNTVEELGLHFITYHPIGTPYNLADKIFKIHEKIEYYEEGQYPHEVRILKSLLENEK